MDSFAKKTISEERREFKNGVARGRSLFFENEESIYFHLAKAPVFWKSDDCLIALLPLPFSPQSRWFQSQFRATKSANILYVASDFEFQLEDKFFRIQKSIQKNLIENFDSERSKKIVKN